MDLNRMQSLTDTIHNSIDYSGIEREILGTPIFNRLHRVMQSSLVFLTYSSNKTKRFEHSIGVMDLAGKMFFSSVCNTKSEILLNLINEIKDAIKLWRKNTSIEHLSMTIPRGDIVKFNVDKILTLQVPENSLYKKYFPENISNLSAEDKFAYYVAFQAIRIAALLHDVGHMPYSHVLEHAINNLYRKVSSIPENTRNENQNKFIRELYNYCDPQALEKDEIHEEIGKICAVKIYECIASVTSKDINNLFFVATYDFACSILQSKPSQNDIYSDLHQIVAGIVDSDRLDYCSRDMFNSGIRKDIINYERLFSTYSICCQNTDIPLSDEDKSIKTALKKRSRFYFCPHVKNIQLIEDLLNRRWDIFSLINYHHRVHKHEILLEEVIVDLGYEELLETAPIEPLSQGGLPLKIHSIWQIVSLLKGNDPPEYLLIQFDDSWLDTLLKGKFFYKYYNNFMWCVENASSPKWNRFDELISTQKHYYSLFKRTEDFRKVDFLLFNRFKKAIGPNGELSKILSKEILNKIILLFSEINDYNSFLVKNKILFFSWLISNTIFKVSILPEDRVELYDEIQKSLNSILSSSNKIQDVILRDCTFKSGCATAKNKLMIADNGEAKPFQNYSTIEQIFKERKNFSIPIHLYYLPSYATDAQSSDDFKINVLEDLYPQLVQSIWNVISSRIEINTKAEVKNV